MAPKAVVVGWGSIGARHARLLEGLTSATAVVSRRPVEFQPVYDSVEKALSSEQPDYVIVATETSRHKDVLTSLAQHGYEGIVLVEKPLFERSYPLPKHSFSAGFVGYNLRFHPTLAALKRHIGDQHAVSAQVYVGQYLPDWRPDRDYRTCYSGSAALGGGALRDLSHELDYLSWLFGPWQRIAALGGRLGDLEIDSDDCWALLIEFERCSLTTVQINFLDRAGRREIVVNTETNTYAADLIGCRLECNREAEEFTIERDATFVAQHRAALAKDHSVLCSLEEGLRVTEMIEAIERAAREAIWVRR